MVTRRDIRGKRLLLVEDDFGVARAMCRALASYAVEIVGPTATVESALALVDTNPLDGAILDINLRGKTVYPVADALAARGVPFVFATGYDHLTMPARFHAYPLCQKPVDVAALLEALFGKITDDG